MANFSAEIRRDLLAHLPKTRAGAAAALAGLLATGASLTEDGFEIVSENERVAAYFLRLAEFFGARPEVREAMRDPKRKRDKLVIFCGGEEAARILAETRSLHEHLVEDEDAALCYLRAAFIGGGSCTLPHGGASTGYHFECVFFTQERAEEFCELLSGFELYGTAARRYLCCLCQEPRGDLGRPFRAGSGQCPAQAGRRIGGARAEQSGKPHPELHGGKCR